MSARILVVDDVPANVRVLEAKLLAEYFDVCTASDGSEALEVAQRELPDLILLDVMMPGLDGYETCRRLKGDSRTRHIPVVMVTALDARTERLRGLEAGADDFLTKPVDDVTLFARVRSLLRLKGVMDELRLRDRGQQIAGEGQSGLDWSAHAVIIAGSARNGDRFASALPAFATHEIETEPTEALAAVEAGADFALVDLTAQDFDGLRVCARIRATPKIRELPLLAVINPDDVATAVRALDLGVNDFVHRPIDAEELAVRVKTQLRRKHFADQLRESIDERLELAVTDTLTGLNNRAFISARLNHFIDAANAGGAPVSVMLIDVDHFKRINDTHGHEAGDHVLQDFARRLQRGLRALDHAGRWGGEEFVIVMPGSGLAEAEAAAERLRQRISGREFSVDDCLLPVTASFGVAQLNSGEDMQGLLRRADIALYEAKNEGRNRVEAATSAAA